MWVLSKDLTYSILREFKPVANHLHLLSMTTAPKDRFSISPKSFPAGKRTTCSCLSLFYSYKTLVLLANTGGVLGALFVQISREGASTPSVPLFLLILLG